MSPEREPMENDSNSRTAEELEQQTVDVYVERALHGPVFRMSYEHTHTYCEIFYLKSGTCTYTVNQGQWHLEAGDLFIVAAGDPHSTRYEGKTSCERIIVFCKSDVLAGMMRGDPTEVQQALERSCKVILNAETRTMVEALLDQMLLENDLPRKYSEQVLELESLHLVLLLLRNGIFSHETMSPKEGYPDVHNLIMLCDIYSISLDDLTKGDIETMKKEVANTTLNKSPQDAIQLIQSGLVMIIGLLIAVTGLIITLNGGSTLWGYGLMMIGAALACFFAFYADYLKRKNKIQTYKELSDFYDYSMKLLNQDNH